MRVKIMLSVIVFTVFALAVTAQAGAKAHPDLKGWEPGGEYDKQFAPKEIDTLKGRVTKIYDLVPLPGMAPGLVLQVEDKKDKGLETVHLGPKDFVDLSAIGLRVGDEVKIVGSWIEMDGQDVMMAIKLKKDDQARLKVRRTKDGFPFWALSPEDRAREGATD